MRRGRSKPPSARADPNLVRFLLRLAGVIRITLLLALVLSLASIAGLGHDARSAGLDDVPVVTVYGADGERWTESMLSSLRRSGLPFVYKIHDGAGSAEELQAALRAAGITRCCPRGCAYKLPVVTVDTQLMINPRPSVVKAAFRHAG